MKTAAAILAWLLPLAQVISQPINFKVYNPTGGFLRLISVPHKPGENIYYLKNNKPVATREMSDLYVKLVDEKDTIHINSFYSASDAQALSYTLIRSGGEIHCQAYEGYDEQGDLLGYAHHLYRGRGISLVRDHENMGVEIYRNGAKTAQYSVGKIEEERLIVYEIGNIKKQGVLDMEGELLVPAQYELINLVEQVFVVRSSDHRVGAFDFNGKPVVPCEYDQVIPEAEMIITWINIKDNDKENYGIFDRKGKMISPPVNSALDFTSGPLPVAGPGGNLGYVDKSANLITGFDFKYARRFSEGMAAVGNAEGKYGFIDANGKLVVPFKYSTVADFKNGHARVAESRFKKGFDIDREGNKVD
jgi:hypothetical protein